MELALGSPVSEELCQNLASRLHVKTCVSADRVDVNHTTNITRAIKERPCCLASTHSSSKTMAE